MTSSTRGSGAASIRRSSSRGPRRWRSGVCGRTRRPGRPLASETGAARRAQSGSVAGHQCPVGRTCDLPGPVVPTGRSSRRERSPRGRGRTLEPPAVIPDWMRIVRRLCRTGGLRDRRASRVGGRPRPVAFAPASRRIWSCARRRSPRGTSPHFAIRARPARQRIHRAAIERGLGRRAARHHDRVARRRVGAARRDLARAPCSSAAPSEENRFDRPSSCSPSSPIMGDRTPRPGDPVDRNEHRTRSTTGCDHATRRGQRLDRWVVFVLIVFGVLFLIIEFFALVVGLVARQVDHADPSTSCSSAPSA